MGNTKFSKPDDCETGNVWVTFCPSAVVPVKVIGVLVTAVGAQRDPVEREEPTVGGGQGEPRARRAGRHGDGDARIGLQVAAGAGQSEAGSGSELGVRGRVRGQAAEVDDLVSSLKSLYVLKSDGWSTSLPATSVTVLPSIVPFVGPELTAERVLEPVPPRTWTELAPSIDRRFTPLPADNSPLPAVHWTPVEF